MSLQTGSDTGKKGKIGQFFKTGGERGGCSGLVLLLILLPLLLIFGIFTLGRNVISYFSDKPTGYHYEPNYVAVEERLPGKQKLPASKCKASAEWMEILIDGALTETDEASLKNALRYFYGKTGVQPYFILTDRVNNSDYPNDDEVNAYLTERYAALFGEDQGHYILLMVMKNGAYMVWDLHGTDAATVIDEDGRDILFSYIASNAAAGFTLTDVVSSALRQTADNVIDGVTVTRYVDQGENVYETEEKDLSLAIFSGAALLMLTVAIIVIGSVVISRYRKAQMALTLESDYRTEDYDEEQIEEEARRAAEKKPSVCPLCGATDPPDERGSCPHCGAPM